MWGEKRPYVSIRGPYLQNTTNYFHQTTTQIPSHNKIQLKRDDINTNESTQRHVGEVKIAREITII